MDDAFPFDDSRCANCGAPTERVEIATPPKPGYWVQRYVPPQAKRGLPASVVEALNSGDGVYRP